MRRAEQLHEEILAQMDLSKEASDEELLELIHRILEEKSKEEFIPLGEKAILGRELFNAFRKLDILQELIEDEDLKNSPIAFPDLTQYNNLETFLYLGEDGEELYNKYWKEVMSN